jgi:antitoxin FitA
VPILHVRNVPDDLYERIRSQAQAENRSISAEVITMLQHALDEASSLPEDAANARRAEHVEAHRRRAFRSSPAGASDSAALPRHERRR